MNNKRCYVIALLFLLPQVTAQGQNLPQLGKHPTEDVIRAMTTEEKARLLVGMGMNIDLPGMNAMDSEDKKIPEKVPGAAGRTHAIPRLGIPSITLSDGPAGVRIDPIRKSDESRTFYATAFPVATLMASTWDTALAEKVGTAFGEELRDYGIDILLAPAMNIHRNPLGGRNFEYYSEDPVVTGYMAAAFVNGVESKGVGTSIKHFAANNQEFNRMQSNTIVSERALREIYLRGFEIAVKKAQPWTVMSSYNLINGTYTSQSPALLDTILRQEWSFNGLVMTDWFGGQDVVAQMKAGNDVIMPGSPDKMQAIIEAINKGTLSMAQLDANVKRVLDVILQTPTFKRLPYSEKPDLEKHAQIAREAAAEGMVLLKNENGALPLKPTESIALFGNASYRLYIGGTGSGDVNEAYIVSLDDGLEKAGFKYESTLASGYKKYVIEQAQKAKPQMAFMLPPPIPEMPLEAGAIKQVVDHAGVAIITIGRNSGEFTDRQLEGDFLLTDAEKSLIKSVAEAAHAGGKKVVVVMNVAGVTEVASWRDQVDAILLAWQPGQEGGNAIADVLSGKVNPSGKLASTFPVAYQDVPSAKNFPGKELPVDGNQPANPIFGRPAEVTYEEGIFVGYRYYHTFGVKPAYEFGYGLSYTTFEYKDARMSGNEFKDTITASITVTNSGKAAGREVVQVYLSAPGKKLVKPESELRAFAKMRLLQPGESQTLTFTLTPADLSSFDSAQSAWVAEAGTYTVNIGASSLKTTSAGSFQLARDLIVEKVHQVLSPEAAINEMAPKAQK